MNEDLHPDSGFDMGFNYIVPDDRHPIGIIVNSFLSSIGSHRRARVILHEDAAIAWRISTLEEAAEVASRLTIGGDRNFTDPEQSRVSKRIQKRLGLIR